MAYQGSSWSEPTKEGSVDIWRSQIERLAERYSLQRDRIFFLVSGPSGTGKTTLLRRVTAESEGLKRLVATTTRERRPSERDGYDYYFVCTAVFERMIGEGQMIEWKITFGDYYGMSRDELWRYPDHDVVLDMDVKGKDDFVRLALVDCVSIFVMPPSLSVVKERLESRNDLDPGSIERRLVRAEQEISRAAGYDFVVENADLHEAIQQIKAIVFASRSNRDMRLLERVYPSLAKW